MKKQFFWREKLLKLKVACYLFTLLFITGANASHTRGYDMWAQLLLGPGQTYEFTVLTSFDRDINWTTYHPSNPLNPVVGNTINFGGSFPLFFGDGNFANHVATVTAVDLVDDVIICEFTTTHTYVIPGFYIAFVEGIEREGDLQNNAGLMARIECGINAGTNTDPVFRISGLDFYPQFSAGNPSANLNLLDYDPDGVYYFFSLAPPGSFGPGAVQPTGFSVSPAGMIMFNTVGKIPGQVYSAAIRATDAQGNYKQFEFLMKLNAECPWSGSAEICNAVDDDCDGLVDEGFPDFDNDGIRNCVDPDDDNDGVPDPYDCEPLNKKKNKWLVCHNGHTNCIAQPAVQAHLNHGDQLGACPSGNRGGEPELITIVDEFKLSNSPNPSTANTTIRYELPVDSKVNIVLYDPMGRVVATLVDASRVAGTYNYELNTSKLAAGVYYYKMTAVSGADKFVQSQKLMIVK